ncbi:16277_t:CDS:2, partial [Gigaspora rosea]
QRHKKRKKKTFRRKKKKNEKSDKDRTPTFVAISKPATLDEAIVSARRDEAGEYYSKQIQEKGQQRRIEEEL